MNKQLEKIYLANVILYLPSIESIIKFKQINTKCLESTLMIRFYSKRFEKDVDYLKFIKMKKEMKEMNYLKEYEQSQKIIPKNLFLLFPTIETIECTTEDILKYQFLIDQVKQIQLEVISFPKHFTNEIKEKVISLRADFCSKVLTKYPLQLFPNIRYLIFYINTNNWKRMEKLNENELNGFNERIEKVLNDKMIKLRSLIIYSKCFDDMSTLLTYPNIEMISLGLNEMMTSQLNDQFHLLEKRCFIVSNYFDEFDCSEYIMNTQEDCNLSFINDNMKLYNSLPQKYLKIPLQVNKYDLRKCKSLKRLEIGENRSVLINGLTQLEEITNCYQFDILPESLHKLSFTANYQYNQNTLSFITQYPQIDEICMEMETNVKLDKFIPFDSIKLKTLELTYIIKEHFGFDNMIKEIKKLSDNTSIDNKIVHFHCCHMQPSERLMKKLQKYMTVTIDIFVEIDSFSTIQTESNHLELSENQSINEKKESKFINIKQIPSSITSLKMYGHFRSQYFNEQRYLSNITKVIWEIQKKGDVLCLSELSELNELVIKGYINSSAKLVNLSESKKLKSLECFGFGYEILLPQCIKSLIIHNNIQMINLHQLPTNSLKSIDLLVSKNLNFSRFEKLQNIQLRSDNLSRVVITLPCKIKSLIYSGKFITIRNLNTIQIETFQYQWDCSYEDIIFTHWNYETENELIEMKSLQIKISQNFDFRKYKYLKTLQIEGSGDITVPYEIEHIVIIGDNITINDKDYFESIIHYEEY